MSKQKREDQARRERLQSIVHDHLLEVGQLPNVEGMGIDANVVRGVIDSWVWRVKLTNGDIYTYTMNNTDDAPVHCNGEEIEQ